MPLTIYNGEAFVDISGQPTLDLFAYGSNVGSTGIRDFLNLTAFNNIPRTDGLTSSGSVNMLSLIHI